MQDFDREFRIMRWVVGTMFVVIALLILITMGVTAYLGVSCYMSNDPNSMACYMISDRVEVGVRNR